MCLSQIFAVLLAVTPAQAHDGSMPAAKPAEISAAKPAVSRQAHQVQAGKQAGKPRVVLAKGAPADLRLPN
ncbi:MAG: hypothetical protein K2Q10_03340 [Rhodospirillales bacterium]|nr:hypothetical protein [Rhodospirillales bacterium]